MPLAVVLFPSLSREVAGGNHSEFIGLLTRALRFLTLRAAADRRAVRDHPGRGRSPCCSGGSTEETIELTATTLQAFLVGLVAHGLIAVLARAFYALQDTRTPVARRGPGRGRQHHARHVVLVEPLGLPGLALAIALAAWLEAAVLTVLLRRRVGRFGLSTLSWLGLRTVLATAAAGLAGVVVHDTVGPRLAPDPAAGGTGDLPGLIAVIVIVSAVYTAVFVGAALALRIEELRSIVEIMVDALRRPRRA